MFFKEIQPTLESILAACRSYETLKKCTGGIRKINCYDYVFLKSLQNFQFPLAPNGDFEIYKVLIEKSYKP